MSKKIIYTDYANDQIKERKLDKALIQQAIAQPESLLEGHDSRKIAQKAIQRDSGEKLLRVIYEENKNIKVITAYLTMKERYATGEK